MCLAFFAFVCETGGEIVVDVLIVDRVGVATGLAERPRRGGAAASAAGSFVEATFAEVRRLPAVFSDFGRLDEEGQVDARIEDVRDSADRAGVQGAVFESTVRSERELLQ